MPSAVHAITKPNGARQPSARRFFSSVSFIVGVATMLVVTEPALAGKELHDLTLPAPQRPPKPLFELGVVVGGAYLPDYPAAAQRHLNGIALPYFAFRGKIFRSDEKGLLRSRLVKTDRLEFDISLDGAFASDSDKNDARRGMPDLDWLGEVGPRLQWTVARAAHSAKVDLELAVRAAFSTDLSRIESRGYVFEPEIAYQHENFLQQNLEVKWSLGAVFATEDLMDYFYEVEPRFVSAARPTFDAKSGYLGTRSQLSLVKELGPRFSLLTAFRLDYLGGAENEDSPLFKNEVTFGAGAALVWSFYQSKARAHP